MKPLMAIAATVLVLAPSAFADSLTAHDKAALEILIFKHGDVCVDCEWAPNFAAAKWKFASDFDRRQGGLDIAYASVRYRSMDKTKTGAWLFGFDAQSARWRILERTYGGAFRCSTDVLVNPFIRIAYQMRMVGKVVRCQ